MWQKSLETGSDSGNSYTSKTQMKFSAWRWFIKEEKTGISLCTDVMKTPWKYDRSSALNTRNSLWKHKPLLFSFLHSLNDSGIYLFLPVEYKVHYSNTEVWVYLLTSRKSLTKVHIYNKAVFCKISLKWTNLALLIAFKVIS